MMISQTLSTPVTICRFDTRENITFEQNDIIEVDEATGNYLLNMKSFDLDGNSLIKFEIIE